MALDELKIPDSPASRGPSCLSPGSPKPSAPAFGKEIRKIPNSNFGAPKEFLRRRTRDRSEAKSKADAYWNRLYSTEATTLDHWFDSIDTDGSGFIERDEMTKWLRKEGLISSDEQAGSYISAIDKDDDGKISRTEFTEFMQTARQILFPLHWIQIGKSADDTPDIYLGGRCTESSWRSDVVIPILTRSEITFHNPQKEEHRGVQIARDQKMKDHARVLLYVVDEQTENSCQCLDLAEQITRGKEVVLVIQDVPEAHKDAALREEQNRMRAYLADMASRFDVPVYTNVLPAVMEAVAIVKMLREE